VDGNRTTGQRGDDRLGVRVPLYPLTTTTLDDQPGFMGDRIASTATRRATSGMVPELRVIRSHPRSIVDNHTVQLDPGVRLDTIPIFAHPESERTGEPVSAQPGV